MIDKLYREKKDIINWLHLHEVKNFTLVEDKTYGYVVDTQGTVNLYSILKESLIAVKFNNINGHFDCGANNLKSLMGCPETVTGNFLCNENKLISLEGGPTRVELDYFASNNGLTTLKGSPQRVRDFYVEGNQLTNLEEGPKDCISYDCSLNNLSSLKGAPSRVEEHFIVIRNPISSYEYGPQFVGDNLYLQCTLIDRLEVNNLSVGGKLYLSDILKQNYELDTNNISFEAFKTIAEKRGLDKLIENIPVTRGIHKL